MARARRQVHASRNGIRSPEINSCISSQLTPDKGAKSVQLQEGLSFQQRALGPLESHREMMWDPFLPPHAKINSQWIKELKARANAVSLRRNLGGLKCGKGFLRLTKSTSNKRKTKHISHHQNLKLLYFRGHQGSERHPHRMGKNIPKSYTS